MGFVIDISEVAEPEYPLLETLRETIFSECGHRSTVPIAESLAGRQDLLALIAHLEGNPVGFSVGYRRAPGQFYVNYLGVLRDYRREGLGRQLIERQEQFARARGYTQVEFNTFNHFGGMIQMGLAMGYRPVGVAQHEHSRNDLAIRFAKSIGDHATAAARKGGATGPETRVPADDAAALREALDRGMMITGLVRDPGDGQLRVVLVQSAAP